MTTLTLTDTVHHTDTRRTCAGCGARVYAYAEELEDGTVVRHYCTTCAHRQRGTLLCRACQRPIQRGGNPDHIGATGWEHTEPTRWGGKHPALPEDPELSPHGPHCRCADCFHGEACQCGCNEPLDPAYVAYLEDMERREAEGRPWPVGEPMACYQCEPKTDIDDSGFPCVMRVCTGLGPVVNRADPTQSYTLDCGHGAI